MPFGFYRGKRKASLALPRYSILGIFLLSLILRMSYINFLARTNPFFDYPIVDSEVYHEWAIEIMRGDLWGKDIFYLAPGYAYFLAVIYSIFGINFYIVYSIQAILDSISVLLIFWIGRIYFSEKTGIVASAFWCFYGPSAFYTGKIAAEPLGIFLLLLAVFILGKAMQGSHGIFFSSGGFVLGLAILTRTYWLLLIPFWIACISIFSKFRFKKKASAVALFVFGLSLSIGPVTIRNVLITGESILISGNSGLIFYSGNNPKARGFSTYIDGVSLNVKEQWEDSRKVAELESKRTLTRKEVDRYWRDKAIEFIVKNPGDYLLLLGKKLLAGLSGDERSTMYFLDVEREMTPFLRIFFLNFYIIMPLGLTGIFIKGNLKRDGLILSIPVAHLLILLIFMAESRYRLPSVPVLCLFASSLIIGFRDFIRKWPIGIPLILILSVFSLHQYWKASINPHRPPEIYYNAGNAYLHRGDLKKALDQFKVALFLRPEYPELLNNMGKVYYLMGDDSEAIRYWENAHRLKPDYILPVYNLAKVYQKKDPERAKAYWHIYLNMAKDIQEEALYREEGERFLRER